jgi:hypothetical protein
MKYAVQIDLGATIYIPSFIKIGYAIRKLMGRGGGRYTDTHTQHGDRISLLLFLKIKKACY